MALGDGISCTADDTRSRTPPQRQAQLSRWRKVAIVALLLTSPKIVIQIKQDITNPPSRLPLHSLTRTCRYRYRSDGVRDREAAKKRGQSCKSLLHSDWLVPASLRCSFQPIDGRSVLARVERLGLRDARFTRHDSPEVLSSRYAGEHKRRDVGNAF